MLTLQPALRAGKARTGGGSRIGLALAGGGPLGAFYEIGALHALAEGCSGLDLTALDVYVGVSSGAMIAAALVNGVDPADMGVVFIANAAVDYPMTPGLFLWPALAEYAERLALAPQILADAMAQFARVAFTRNWAESLAPLGRMLPSGIFDNRPFERYLRHYLSRDGRTNDFRKLRAPLYVVATDLDAGQTVRFGGADLDHVPISTAIQASCALPGLYPPVRIHGHTYVDGALTRTMNASLALEAGADLVLCLNPLVAFDAYDGGRRRLELEHGGFPTVMAQTFRSLIQSRMQVGMASYRERFPKSDMLLFEPDRSDEAMFFVNAFKYSDRQRMVEHCYQRTRRDLLRNAPRLEPLLRRHGLALRRDVLEDPKRTFNAVVRERRLHHRPVTGPLHAALDQLDTWVREHA